MIRVAVAVAFVLAFLLAEGTGGVPELARSALADGTDEQFNAATAYLAKEKFADAAAEFLGLADAAPKHRLADDALFAAAKLYEERLGKPKKALELYKRLVRDYADSREALAAKRRAAELTRAIGVGGKDAPAMAAYTDVLQRFHQRTEAQSIQRMEKVISDYPNWSGITDAMLWLGTLHERKNRLSAADKWYVAAAKRAEGEQVGTERNEHLFNAYRGAGDVAAKRDQFAKARNYYERMPIDGDASKMEARKQLLADLATKKARTTYYWLTIALLSLLVLAGIGSIRTSHGSWTDAARAVARPPTEVIFMLPVAAILMVASFTGHHPTAKAVTIIAIGGVAIAWLNGAGMTGSNRSRVRLWLHLVGSAAAAFCLCYIALHVTDLIDQMMNVLRLGPDVG